MPSLRPRAAFEPISPELDLPALVRSSPNFEYVKRIQCDQIDIRGQAMFERLVLDHVVLRGKPLVIEGYQNRLNKQIFSVPWLLENCGSILHDARDLTRQTNIPVTMERYLKHMALLTNQWSRCNYKQQDRQRVYLKDIDCPSEWEQDVFRHLPAFLHYLNENTKEHGQPTDEVGTGEQASASRAIARAGDLMSSLPAKMRAENLMCYIGHEGTYTPAHREMCASLGQNLMVEASDGSEEDGRATHPGSSIWFMTETKERQVVAEYFLSGLGHDIEIEKHFAQINAWRQAPFRVYIVEQRPGDFILIPPLAPHQVWNRGTRTMKVAWNRTTVETLGMAMDEALFKARMVCRDEQYKNKAIIYFTLQKYADLLRRAQQARLADRGSAAHILQLVKDFQRLHNLYTRILIAESFDIDHPEKIMEVLPFDSCVTCSYCRGNIFNRFLTCPSCVADADDGSKDTYDICLDCYAMGRSCGCVSKLRWVEQWQWDDLVRQHEEWRLLILDNHSEFSQDDSRTFREELNAMGETRTTARICQMELARRPWRDIRAPATSMVPDSDHEEETQVNGDGTIRRSNNTKSEQYRRHHARCHVDCHWEPRWKQAQCTECDKSYCYGVLFRAYDMLPQDILANPRWKCPSCLRICNCRYCRVLPGWKKYSPRGTLLGHNTKDVADARSVESLVDFSCSNWRWIAKADDDYIPEDTRRLLRRRKQANAAMSQEPDLSEHYVDLEEDEDTTMLVDTPHNERVSDMTIDPALLDNSRAQDNDAIHSLQDSIVNDNPEQAASQLPGLTTEHVRHEIPEGGIVQNPQLAYENTDMITYVYPEPISNQWPEMPTDR